MAPKRKAAFEGSKQQATNGEEQQHEPVKLQNLYDGAAVKGALDEAAREVVVEAGYEEDFSVSNVKLGLGLIAIALALYAQFGPGKFPANWWMIFFCVVGYSVVSLVLNYYTQHFEGESFMITKPSRTGEPGPRLSSRLDKYDDQYTLSLSSGTEKAPNLRVVSLTDSVANFFHEDGYMAEAAFKAKVTSLLKEYASKKA